MDLGRSIHVKEFREKLESEGVIIGLESKWIRKDGSEIFVRESAKVFRDENGEVLYYDGSFEDITERKSRRKTNSANFPAQWNKTRHPSSSLIYMAILNM